MVHVFSSIAKFSAPGTRMAPTGMPHPNIPQMPAMSLQSMGMSMTDVVNRGRVARSMEITNGERPSNIM